MIFRKSIEADIHDVDFNGVARTSSLMRYIQSAAQAQLTENGMSYDELQRMNRAFLLSRITMEFTEPIRAYDKLTALTFPLESRGYSFLRCYALEKDGRTVGKAVSAWALVDTKSHSLVRVDRFNLGLTTHDPNGIVLSKFFVPSALVEVGKYKVLYGVTDQNMHMNNTTYPDMYSSYLPLENKRIKTISINYLSEAPHAKELTVLRGIDENGIYYFRTVREDGKTNSEAQIILENL